MPSKRSMIVREEIRLLKPLLEKVSIPRARSLQDMLGVLGEKSVAGRVDFNDDRLGDFEVCFAIPKNESDPGRAILYLHGGGYVTGNLKYARGFAGLLADRTRRRVLAVAYRLAPEHTFPAALDDATEAYKYLLSEGYESKNIAFAGESAGGGLVYCLCLKLKELGLPLPAALVAISPWTDLTFSGASCKTNVKKDPTIPEKVVRGYARFYAKGDYKNPLVSPLFGDLTGLPPSLLFAGGDELILDDAVRLASRLEDCGCHCELCVEEGLWHVYVLYGIPEARAAQDKIVAFLEQWQ